MSSCDIGSMFGRIMVWLWRMISVQTGLRAQWGPYCPQEDYSVDQG